MNFSFRPYLHPIIVTLGSPQVANEVLRRMTLSEKAEQSLTSRPNSYVPARTLERLVGVRAGSDFQLWSLNMAMHYGQGAVAGMIRAYMSWRGVRGPFADLIFVGIRLFIDQTLENWTGVGALPWYVGSER